MSSDIGPAAAGLATDRNAHGRVYFRDQYFALDHRHGRFRLESALRVSAGVRRRLGEGLTAEELRDAAYLDIETGAQSETSTTFAFLVGIGTFEAFSFRVRQVFLGEPDGERAMLAAVAESVRRCSCVVTFNGRVFDLPQLAGRFAAAGLEDPFAGMRHVDLLVAARSLYAGSLESRRLGEIESKLLGVRRRGDVPGPAIPVLYARYSARRDAFGLHPVFKHNSQDVLSLAAFLAFLNREAGSKAARQDARRRLARGRWEARTSRPEQAIEHYRAAWQLDADGLTGGESVARLAQALGRTGDWQACLEVWREELARTQRRERRVRACIELAKLHERRLRDPCEALRLALEARRLIEESGSPQAYVRSSADLVRRIGRLEGRTG